MIAIRPAKRSDIGQLAEIHAAALAQDLLPRLGVKFLKEYFFPTVIEASSARVLIAEENGSVLGFCIFAENNTELSAAIFGSKAKVGRYYLAALLKHPYLIRDLYNYVTGYVVEFYSLSPDKIANVPEIFLIATMPGHQSKGIGRMIVEKGLEKLQAERKECIVRTASAPAERFYRKSGFAPIGVEKRGRANFKLLRWVPR